MPSPAAIIQMGDENGDKALDRQEWAALDAPWPYPQGADSNNDGKLDAGELSRFLPSASKTISTPIVAVVPDFSFLTGWSQPRERPSRRPSTLPGITRGQRAAINIKLKGQQIPETLAAIDQLWNRTNPGTPINRFFMNEHMQQLYLSMLRQAQLFAVFSGIAVFLACLGLLGLSISTAERRTKEIGIRKAMGAGSGDITRLLLWQFVKPVLWANLIAWPLACYV